MVDDVSLSERSASISNLQERKQTVHFCLNANKAREAVRSVADVPGLSDQERANLLTLDIVLDDFSQKMLARYKDHLFGVEEKLATNELFEGVAVLGEALKAAVYNSELPSDVLSLASTFSQFSQLEQVTPERLHSALLAFPVLRNQDDLHWQRFRSVAAPEMIEMLVRMGVGEEVAMTRVYFTDLVEFRKSSTAFVAESLLNEVEEGLARLAPGYKPEIPKASQMYETFLGEKVLEGEEFDNPEVKALIGRLSEEKMPSEVSSAKAFLDKLAASPQVKADKLATALIKGYLDRESWEKKYTKQRMVIGGKTSEIEFYPFSFYGCDMVVISVDGKIVEDPEKFLKEKFSVPKVILGSLREGD